MAGNAVAHAAIQSPIQISSAHPGPAVLSAIIGSATAVAGILLKDFAFAILAEKRLRKRSEAHVYRQYLAPMSAASEKLMWRSREIFVDMRHNFLKTTALPLEFNRYKRRSTLYRIATLVGWIRGMSLELAAAPRGATPALAPLARQIAEFQSALADGPYVERHRLEQVCAIWGIDLSGASSADLRKLAFQFETALHSAAGNTSDTPLSSLPDDNQYILCDLLMRFVCNSLGIAFVERDIVSSRTPRVINALTYREALLYRDWQDALGDAMLLPDPDSSRRYKVIGYEAFCELLDNSPTPWMKVLSSSIDDIDFDTVDKNDFRAQQLRNLSRSVAGILIEIHKHKEERFLVSAETAKAAREMLRDIDSGQMSNQP